jgi:hypothetical protein
MAAALPQKVIYINSSVGFRDAGGSNEDFTITETGHHFASVPKRVKLVKASIPYSWNNITANNNVFAIQENPGNSATITVPAGAYNGTTLASTIQTLLGSAGLLNTYTVTFDTSFVRFNFAGTGAFTLSFTPASSIAMQLGFVAGSTYGPDTSITSANVAQLVPDYEIFICSDLVEGSDNGVVKFTPDPPISAGVSGSQILASVPLSTCFGGVINYCACDGIPFFPISQSLYGKVLSTGDNSSKPIRFFLAFPSGIPVFLNGLHWSAQLVFEF